MYVREKSIVTVLIWLIVGAVLVTALNSPFNNVDPLPLSAIMAFAAAFATRFIWSSALGVDAVIQGQMAGTEKRKHPEHSRVGQLLSHLDADEIDELRARLEAEEGGTASFDDLLRRR